MSNPFITSPVSNSIINKRPIGWLALIISLFIIVIPMFIAINSNYELIFFIGLLSIPLLYLIINNSKIWIYTAFIALAYFLRDSSEVVSEYDVVSGAFYIGGLIIWSISRIFVNRQKIVHSFTDWLILAFFSCLIPNLIIALLNGVELIDWLREFAMFLLILYYFPIKDIIKSKRDIITLLCILLISAIILNLLQFYQYFLFLQNYILYVYQLGAAIKYNQPLYASAIIFGIAFASIQKKIGYKYLLLLFTVMTVTALVATFSRAYWVMVLINLLIIIFFIPKDGRKFMVSSIVLGGILFSLFIYVAFQDKVEFVYYVIEKRFVSTTAGVKDISLQMRLNEFEGVFEQIENYPLGGSGLARKFSYYDPIGISTQRTNFVHNGYLYLIYRLGYPLAIIFFIYLFLILMKSFYYSFKVKDRFYKTLAICSATSILMMILTNFVTTTIPLRDGSLIMALLIGFISIIERKVQIKEIE